jgi:hypothetical protein
LALATTLLLGDISNYSLGREEGDAGLMFGSLPPCEYLMVLQLISTALQLRQAMNGASAGRNIGLSLGVFVYAILIMGRKCREMSGWDSLMKSGLNYESTILTYKMAGISFRYIG